MKNVYPSKLMDDYNKWCEHHLEKFKNDPNIRHPKQKNKYLINDIIGRMGETEPDLLISIIANKVCMEFRVKLLPKKEKKITFRKYRGPYKQQFWLIFLKRAFYCLYYKPYRRHFLKHIFPRKKNALLKNPINNDFFKFFF